MLQLLCLSIIITYLQQVNSFSFGSSLSENLLVNGNFSSPSVTSFAYLQNIPGWSCSVNCEVDNCTRVKNMYTNSGFIVCDCEGQVIDLDSNNHLENLSQVVDLKAGEHQITFDYYFPYKNANRKKLFVRFNEDIIVSVFPNVMAKFGKLTASKIVIAKEGQNNLSFSMTNSRAIDGAGFFIGNVQIRRIESNIMQLVINNTLVNSVNQFLLGSPGSRVFFGQIMHHFISLDRLQFYYFHNRKKSYYEEIFQSKINEVLNMKGLLTENYLKDYIPILKEEEQYLSSLNQKLPYTDDFFFQKNQESSGFIANNKTVFLFSFPSILLIQIFLAIFYWLFSKSRVNRFLKKYSLFGLTLLLMTEGNIEQFTFYMFSEFSLFFSSTFLLKMVNAGLLIFYFLVLFTTFAFYFWFKFHYRKLMKFMIEETKLDFNGLLSCSIDKGIICFLSGVAHQILLKDPKIQLIVLGIFQSLWLGARIFFLIKAVYKRSVLISFDVILGMITIIFQISCYLYQSDNCEYQNFLNDSVHKLIILTFVGIWILQFLIIVIFSLNDIIKAVKWRSIKVAEKVIKDKVAKKRFRLKPLLSNALDGQKFNQVIRSKTQGMRIANNQMSQLIKCISRKKPYEKLVFRKIRRRNMNNIKATDQLFLQKKEIDVR